MDPLVRTAAPTGAEYTRLDLSAHWIGYMSVAQFIPAYALVISEASSQLRKSKAVTPPAIQKSVDDQPRYHNGKAACGIRS